MRHSNRPVQDQDGHSGEGCAFAFILLLALAAVLWAGWWYLKHST